MIMFMQLSSTFSFILLLMLLFPVSNSTRIPLAGDDWMIVGNRSFFTRGTIPGTIHTILLAANKIPEPNFGYNDVNLRSLVYSSWIFTRNFSLTQDFLNFKHFTLHFDQIDTVADIILNECFIGQTKSMFIPYSFNVKRSCIQLNNQLRIDFQSPIIYALNQAEIYNDTLLPTCPPNIQHGECHIQFIRKEICSFSWDWGPAFAPMGIPGDLYFEGVNTSDISMELESINVAAYHINVNRWQVDILLSSRSEPFMCQLKFVLENTSFIYETNETFSYNMSISLLIPDENIQLWWPNGYGEQILYKLSVYHQRSVVGSRLIGFRTVQLSQHDYGPTINGTSFYFLVNYQQVFIKGSNWIPPDTFQERVTDEKLERLLCSAQLANMNMLRISGVGIYERDSFYEIADRLGIMIWHDFMFGCALYPVDESFLTSVHTEIIYQVKRLQSHPSIVLWAGNNENEVAIAENWYGIPAEKMSKAKSDYRKINVDIIMNAVKEVDKGNNRPFIISSPSNGLESIEEDYIASNPNSPLYGDVHFYGFHNDTWDPSVYPITRFLTETGIQSLPSLQTWNEVTKNLSDLNFDSDLVQHREHSDGQMGAMMMHIKSNLPLPITNNSLINFTQLIYLSQINQAMTLKTISDLCRLYSSVDMIDPETSQGNTMGLMYWQINDIWQGTTWSTIEYGLKWKMSHYYVRHMYEPVYPIAILNPYLADITDENARISIYIVNELLNMTHGTLICSIHTLDTFSVRTTVTFDISFHSSTVQHIIDLPYASLMKHMNCSINDNHCLFQCRLNYDHQEIKQTLFLTRPKNYELYQPNLRIESIRQLTRTDFTITITATGPALFVWLEMPENRSGYFTHNGFHMFEPLITINFHSWTSIIDHEKSNLNFQITSLFDVTQM